MSKLQAPSNKAWEAWRASRDGGRCAGKVGDDGVLWRAFIAGFEAALAPRQQHVPPETE